MYFQNRDKKLKGDVKPPVEVTPTLIFLFTMIGGQRLGLIITKYFILILFEIYSVSLKTIQLVALK